MSYQTVSYKNFKVDNSTMLTLTIQLSYRLFINRTCDFTIKLLLITVMCVFIGECDCYSVDEVP